jgi:hypothetical protein
MTLLTVYCTMMTELAELRRALPTGPDDGMAKCSPPFREENYRTGRIWVEAWFTRDTDAAITEAVGVLHVLPWDNMRELSV